MHKIIPLLLLIFVLSGCGGNLQTNNQLNITETSNDPSVVYVEPVVDEKIITDLTFNDLSNSNNTATSTIIGKIIRWKGKISNQSQIDGIKFWSYDDEFIKGERKEYEFFWASPEDLLDITVEQHKGKWVNYTLKRYDGLISDEINIEEDIYLVIGKFRGLDCEYYNYEGSDIKFCIPLVDIIDIDLLGKVSGLEL